MGSTPEIRPVLARALPDAKRVLLLGATGTIGRATAAALLRCEHSVVCFNRNKTAGPTRGVEIRHGDIKDPHSLATQGFRGQSFDAVISCMASRTGSPKDAWDVDYQANLNLLEAAQRAGVTHFVLLSAICVQKPLLAFQQAKLAFERQLIGSGMRYSIVRPTAFFKSLSGQIERVKGGKSFLMFGQGELTACKPISDADLASFLVGCLVKEEYWNRVLPIGGPGNAVTPRQIGESLFAALGRPPRFTCIPVALLDRLINVLHMLGKISPKLADKAELARIGRYYATESMLVWDPVTARYQDTATPSTGTETLFDFFTQVLAGKSVPERGDHAVF